VVGLERDVTEDLARLSLARGKVYNQRLAELFFKAHAPRALAKLSPASRIALETEDSAGDEMTGTVAVLFDFRVAANVRVSKRFRISSPQRLAGVLQDRQGARIGKTAMDILQGDRVVAHAETNESGEYDFGIVPAGEYQIRFSHPNSPWCAPAMRCKNGVCGIRPRVEVCQVVDHKNCPEICL
jgi:hypothetical protein